EVATGASVYEPIRQSAVVTHAKAVKAARAARAAKAARAARAKAARARAARARAAQAAAPVRPAETNRPAPRPAGCGQITRMVSVTENVWRIECGPRAFLVRTAPDGYATTVRRVPWPIKPGRVGRGCADRYLADLRCEPLTTSRCRNPALRSASSRSVRPSRRVTCRCARVRSLCPRCPRFVDKCGLAGMT